MVIEGGKVKKKAEKKRYFENSVAEEAIPEQPNAGIKNATKIIFTDDGEQRVVPVESANVPLDEHSAETDAQDALGKGGKRKHAKGGRQSSSSIVTQGDGEVGKRWYEHHETFNTQAELIELKDAEISELRRLCTAAFDAECRKRVRDNPSDVKWLQSAMEKGTSRDRASSGALLVQTNPFCNLQALETVIGMVKHSNKGHLDVLDVLTELMLNSLMPAYRKLVPMQLRGADWKNIKKLDISKELRDEVYAHWQFEEQLRELYFNFLTNISMILYSGQEASKCKAIVHSSKLFKQIPEKEAFLLTMLVNKFGDPSKIVASKALYHLQTVVQQHSSMAAVMTNETEKLLFRNNVSETAQHYALTFLSIISVYVDFTTCQKMVNVCFAFFKILTDKGEINSRTMQAILTCLRKAMKSIKRDVDLNDIVKPELLNVIFRMIHLADISIACQGLSLLLEVTDSRGQQQNRFYNTLYQKLLDPRLCTVGPRISNVLFYILHRAIQNDPVPERAQAFIKRLLQVAFYFPPTHVCAALIVIKKVLQKRKNLMIDGVIPDVQEEVQQQTAKASTIEREEGDESTQETKPGPARRPQRYDGFHRSAEYAGANYTMKYELTRYLCYFHPTVQKFADCIINKTNMTYYGDPMRDFSLSHFLERFSFKNPKKQKPAPAEVSAGIVKKGDYVPSGSRALPVASLTKDQCTEDEQYIFRFLEQRRERLVRVAEKKARDKRKKDKGGDDADGDDGDDDDEEDGSDVDSLDDDEFDAYLDRLGVPGGQDDDANMDREELDFMSELERDMSSGKKAKAGKQSASRKKAKAAEADDDEDGLDDWDDVGGDDDADDDDDGDDDDGSEHEFAGSDGEDDEFSDGGSVSLDEGDESFGAGMDSEDEDDEGPVVKKRKKSASVGNVSERDFARKLKSTDMNSLFAAADDFSELLEAGVDGPSSAKEGKRIKQKKKQIAASHGTDTEVFNQDASSVKQMAWEQTRFSGTQRGSRGSRGKKQFGAKKSPGGKANFQGRGGGGNKFGGKGKPKHRK